MGLYAANGSINVTGITSTTSLVGAYAADGSLNVFVVPGTSWTGSHSPTGALYVFNNTGGSNRGLYAPCGAMNITTTFSENTGSMKVTLVSGSLGGASGPAFLLEDGTSFLLLEDGTSYLLLEA